MSRSAYDPSPSYATCADCGREYDNSGYYGLGDSHHWCAPKGYRFAVSARLAELRAELLTLEAP